MKTKGTKKRNKEEASNNSVHIHSNTSLQIYTCSFVVLMHNLCCLYVWAMRKVLAGLVFSVIEERVPLKRGLVTSPRAEYCSMVHLYIQIKPLNSAVLTNIIGSTHCLLLFKLCKNLDRLPANQVIRDLYTFKRRTSFHWFHPHDIIIATNTQKNSKILLLY